MRLSSQQIKCLNLLADNDLYEMATKFVHRNAFQVSKAKLHRLKGLIHTLKGKNRIGVTIKYLRHQIQKDTVREEEKNFYDKLVKIINQDDDGLKQYLKISEFSDSFIQSSDSRKERARKREIQDMYLYHLLKAFLNHVIAEKMREM